ncbi:peptidylprolyl isomerase [Gallaecimonas kandeliae]|uniref:peptidylprolyl isomerase n=1 Tax=Gallaecimonas kandeliae TaxID=3029055 RepID=UPI002647E955|nr:peptidylprolyl isomerase [Gallaecimonas kandeliae]WKE66690.1 peptidylprolyl isomerase [Gallaecimonas kandeliae]
MTISKDKVVTIHYTLKDDAGTVLDTSAGGEPLVYLHGHGNLIPGLESELEGKAAGDALDVTVAPEHGYGPYHQELVQEVPRSAFQGVDAIEAGMRFTAQTDAGPRTVVVRDVTDETVTVDGNHPLAGQFLHFSVEIVELRDAEEEELAHGHVHGAGGHHH